MKLQKLTCSNCSISFWLNTTMIAAMNTTIHFCQECYLDNYADDAPEPEAAANTPGWPKQKAAEKSVTYDCHSEFGGDHTQYAEAKYFKKVGGIFNFSKEEN